MSDALLTIGQAAARAGVSTSMLRYYGKVGLLSAQRTTGGQRRYGRDVLRRIAFIQAAQQLGLSLDEIRAAFRGLPAGRAPTRADWRAIAASWQPRLDAQIERLLQLRQTLSSCVGCGCLSIDTCAIFNPGDRAQVLGPGARYLLGDVPADVGIRVPRDKTAPARKARRQPRKRS